MILRLCILLLFSFLFSCKTTTSADAGYKIYLVRHAEKIDDGTRDPGLTKEGIIRAEKLADLMSDKDIQAVYSTDYIRTSSTAKPLSSRLNQEIRLYDPRDLKSTSTLLLSQQENALVVGHSNTTPALANLILGQDHYENFNESQYDQIILIECSKTNCTTHLSRF